MKMNNEVKNFADALLTVVPNFPLTATEIQKQIKEKGVYGFMSQADSQVAELAEMTEILARLKKGGGDHREG